MSDTGDCLGVADALSWMRSHDDGGAAMVYMDPPYGHGAFSDMDSTWVPEAVCEGLRLVGSAGIVYLHCDPRAALQWARDLPLTAYRGQIAWRNGWVSGFKSRSTKFWPRQHQTILGFAGKDWRLRPVPRPPGEYRSKGIAGRGANSTSFVYADWWDDPNPVDQMSWSKEKVGYPTQKPLALLERLILGSTDPGGVVMDPCCGSGTTVVAARNSGRQGWGVDVSVSAVALAWSRIEAHEEHRHSLACGSTRPCPDIAALADRRDA